MIGSIVQFQAEQADLLRRREAIAAQQAAAATTSPALLQQQQPGIPAGIATGTGASSAPLPPVLKGAAADIGKDYSARGITEGPDDSLMPGTAEPEDFRRAYLDQGHGAPSPQSEAPRTSPLPPAGRGILTPIEMPGEPVIGGIPGALTNTVQVHQSRVTLRPPIPGREA